MSYAACDPNSLRTLKALLDEGVLSPDEFQDEKRKLLRRPDNSPLPMGTIATEKPATTTATATVAGVEAAMVKISEMADAMTKFLTGPAEQDRGAQKRTFSEAFTSSPPTPTVWVPSDQPTLFETGVRRVVVAKTPQRKPLKMVGGGHKCPHCDFISPKPGPLAMHLKFKHPKAVVKERSLLNLFANQGAAMSDTQQTRARDVEIAFIIRDLVKVAESTAKRNLKLRQQQGFLQKTNDLRRVNCGAHRRQCRSYGFKKKGHPGVRANQKAAPRSWGACVFSGG